MKHFVDIREKKLEHLPTLDFKYKRCSTDLEKLRKKEMTTLTVSLFKYLGHFMSMFLFLQDFPFLRQHKPRKGVITMENGEMVAVCLDCFDRLRGQFIEAGNLGIPVEKRQYNWMQIPPPPESESLQLVTPQERLSKFTRPALASGLPGPSIPKSSDRNNSAAVVVSEALGHHPNVTSDGPEKLKTES